MAPPSSFLSMRGFDVTDAGNGASLFYLYNRWEEGNKCTYPVLRNRSPEGKTKRRREEHDLNDLMCQAFPIKYIPQSCKKKKIRSFPYNRCILAFFLPRFFLTGLVPEANKLL